MKALRASIWLVAGILLSAAVAEGILRALPVSMGLYRTQRHDLWPLHAYGPQQSFSYSVGWEMQLAHRGRTNNYGHVAPLDFVPGSRPVLVLGDSFIEALMIDYEQTLQGSLGSHFGAGLPVYGLGFSGNSLAEYLATARLARKEFAPTALVIVVIDNDIKESWSNRIGHHFFKLEGDRVHESYLPLDSGGVAQRLRRSIGDSALYRYVLVNLGFSIDGVMAKRRPAPTRPAEDSEKIEGRSRAVIDYFLATLPEASGVPAERIVFVLDSDREKIYDPARADRRAPDSQAIQAYFRERAAAGGFAAIDTAKLFRAYYEKTRRRLDYTPVDRHWSGVAHGVVATEACRTLVGQAVIVERLGASGRSTQEVCSN